MGTIVRDWLLDPLGLVVLWTLALCVGAALTGRRRRRGRGTMRRLAGGLGFFALWLAGPVLVSAPAVVNPLVSSLEDEVPAVACAAGTPVVALGGGVDGAARTPDRFEAMSRKTLARVAEAGRLARAEPGVRTVLAGGARSGVAEADVMAEWLVRTGVARDTLTAERRSTDTVGNAREVALALAGSGAREIRLVTSALHMPRAMGAFRAAGFLPCPVPVDRIAHPDVPVWALWPQTTALVKFDEWLHETLALALYRRRGDFASVPPAIVEPTK